MQLNLITSLSDRQVEDLHRFYQNEWWTQGRALDDIRRMLDHSDSLFGYAAPSDGRLVGFARVLSDRVYKALIFDLIVDPEYRNAGLGRRLMEAIVDHPELRAVKHFELYCLPEMEPFYQELGFSGEVAGVKLLRRNAP